MQRPGNLLLCLVGVRLNVMTLTIAGVSVTDDLIFGRELSICAHRRRAPSANFPKL
jgi:hypothetical protein